MHHHRVHDHHTSRRELWLRRARWWRTQTGLRAALSIAALLLAVASVALMAPAGPNGASVAGSVIGEDTTISDSRTGGALRDLRRDQLTRAARHTAAPLDQPAPVPGPHWTGWTRYPAGRCAWLTDHLLTQLAAQLGPVDPPVPGPYGCSITLADASRIAMTWGRPVSPVHWPAAANTAIAGLDAHTRRPAILRLVYPGICHTSVATRGVTGLHVVSWNPRQSDDRCLITTTVATLVAQALVPAAGGTPWVDTPQTASPTALLGQSPCSLLAGALPSLRRVLALRGVGTRAQRFTTWIDDTGETCQATDGARHLRIRLATADVGDVAASPHRVGTFTAHQQSTTGSCDLILDLAPTRSLHIALDSAQPPEYLCAVADLLAGTVAQAALDQTSTP